MANQSNGGFDSAITLYQRLKSLCEISTWSLLGPIHPSNQAVLDKEGIDLKLSQPVPKVRPGQHLFLYLNEYPLLIRNFATQWQVELDKAASIQLAFNRTLGSIPNEPWLAEKLRRVYFQDQPMADHWRQLTRGNSLSGVPVSILPPPVDVSPFLSLTQTPSTKIRIGRLAGNGAVPDDAPAVYEQLSQQIPNAEFHFMPAPELLESTFSNHPRFYFYQPNQVSVSDFLSQCDIFLFTHREGLPIPGPRSLVEAMAAGCAPVVVNREGPALRVKHGVSGYCFDDNDALISSVSRLANDTDHRQHIQRAARDRARQFSLSAWSDTLLATMNQAALDH